MYWVVFSPILVGHGLALSEALLEYRIYDNFFANEMPGEVPGELDLRIFSVGYCAIYETC